MVFLSYFSLKSILERAKPPGFSSLCLYKHGSHPLLKQRNKPLQFFPKKIMLKEKNYLQKVTNSTKQKTVWPQTGPSPLVIKDCPKHPLADLDPPKNLSKSEKDQQHLTHPQIKCTLFCRKEGEKTLVKYCGFISQSLFLSIPRSL